MRSGIERWGGIAWLACVAGLAAAGCVGSGMSVLSLLSGGVLLASLVLAACADSHRDGGSGTGAGHGGAGGVAGQSGSGGVGGISGVGGVGGISGVGGIGGVGGSGGNGGVGGENCGTYVNCVDGVPIDVAACCPEGAACNYYDEVVCADGSCVPFGQQCIEDCDGTVEQICEDNVLVDACCPVGVECNFGQGMTICGDGSCVNAPDICVGEDCFQGLDCVDGMPMPVEICGCDVTVCNYMPATICGDGSCVPLGQLCAI